MNHNDAFTIGDWPTEHESEAALDTCIRQAGLWKSYPQVTGTLSQPRPAQSERSVRIDRILVPNAKLISLGWRHGVIGIEVKRSKVKIGPPIAQAMDYSRTVWTLPNGGIKVWLDWVFIWPMSPGINGVTESVLAQNRIGSASSDPWTIIKLKCGQNILEVRRDGDIRIGVAPNGQRVGSR